MSPSACPSCNRVADEQFRFCPFCGADLHRPIVCRQCSYPNEWNSKFG
ncbi:MAG: zinc ribbon domain-containing protein [Blastocatellia bacterium]|nr:zinc ribbon domain-containing protein [Blastocatellia bacterium]